MTATGKTILAISGSSREKSYNTALLRNIASLNIDDTKFDLYNGLHTLPSYDPSVADSDMPDSVKAFRTQLQQADAVIFSTPEYAYGFPGILKNGLDWVVASGEMVMKPTVVTSVSTSELGGARAHYALITVLHAMNARVVVDASLMVPFASHRFGGDGQLQDQLLQQSLETSLRLLLKAMV